jgi:hypothetical protein
MPKQRSRVRRKAAPVNLAEPVVIVDGGEASLPEIYRTPQRRRNPRAKSSTTVMNKTHLHPVSIQTPPTVFKSFQHHSQFRQLMKL